jgi:glycosyltransferase involved in cell wall biosynthesis
MDLHIVTLNIPYPPDYGGMIDSYYRIRALSDIGVGIHLHCFEYGRAASHELEAICRSVNYYKRRTGLLSMISSFPYTVSSRRSSLLLDNLLRFDWPVLFDGLHTTAYLGHPGLHDRIKLVRMHNIEHLYYMSLAENESNPLRKGYYMLEARRLRSFDSVLRSAGHLLTISHNDRQYYNSRFGNAVIIPPFHPFGEVTGKEGMGDYVIYHGDLSVNENTTIAAGLITEVFPSVPYRCIIAGKKPPKWLISMASGHKNISVIADPGNQQMYELIADAHVNLLPALSFNGFKLKLLVALFAGRHCVVNDIVSQSTSFNGLVSVADSYTDMVATVNRLMKEPFTAKMVKRRMAVLSADYDNSSNARKIAGLLAQ